MILQKIFFSPSIMCADPLDMSPQLDLLVKNNFDFFHIDIMDFNFVPNLALNFKLVEALDKYQIPRDIHLMVKNVFTALNTITFRSGDYVSFHVEVEESIERNLEMDSKLGVKVGLVINPNTPIELLFPYLSKVDLIHLMSVEPGFAGQPFDKNS